MLLPQFGVSCSRFLGIHDVWIPCAQPKAFPQSTRRRGGQWQASRDLAKGIDRVRCRVHMERHAAPSASHVASSCPADVLPQPPHDCSLHKSRGATPYKPRDAMPPGGLGPGRAQAAARPAAC
eukprot:282402-Chlamydomonas_euryale.AAC.3